MGARPDGHRHGRAASSVVDGAAVAVSGADRKAPFRCGRAGQKEHRPRGADFGAQGRDRSRARHHAHCHRHGKLPRHGRALPRNGASAGDPPAAFHNGCRNAAGALRAARHAGRSARACRACHRGRPALYRARGQNDPHGLQRGGRPSARHSGKRRGGDARDRDEGKRENRHPEPARAL